MKKLGLIIACNILLAINLSAQQATLSNQYVNNAYHYNPAAAGIEPNVAAYIGFKQQWLGISGSPSLRYFSIHSPFLSNMAIGSAVMMERSSVIQRFKARLSYVYRIRLGEEADLGFGIGGMFQELSINVNDVDVDDATDPVLLNNASLQGTSFDANAGLFLRMKDFNFSISGLNLLEQPLTLGELGNEKTNYDAVRHYHALAWYDFHLGETFTVSPMGRFDMEPNSPFSYDGGVRFGWKQTLYLSAIYRKEVGLIGHLGIDIKDWFSLNYAYESSFLRPIKSFTQGSHEIYLGFRFGTKKNRKDEMKSLVDEENKELKDKVTGLETKLEKTKSASDSTLAEKEERIGELEKEVSQLKSEYNKLEDKSKSKEQQESKDDEIMQDQMLAKEETSESEETSDESAGLSKEEKQLTETELLEKGHYIVLKTFGNEDFAREAQKEINSKGYKTLVVFNKKKGYYYIYSERFKTLDSALKELENMRESGFTDAWIYMHQ